MYKFPHHIQPPIFIEIASFCRINAEKLAKLQSQARIGGKGTVRRKVKKVSKTASGETAKLQGALKKVNAQNIPAIEEVNMFKEDGQVIHFSMPKGTSDQCVILRFDGNFCLV